MSRRCVVIAGGGTGGHIYPAIAIARALQEKDPALEVHFVGTPSGLETKIVPKAGYPLHLMKVGKLNDGGGLFGKLRTLFGLPRAFVQSAALLMELKPEAVLGVGGYVSGPFLLVATLMGFKSAIWEPNAKPGLANRWLSRFVKKCFVVFDDAGRELKARSIIPVGLPVREEMEKLGDEPPRENDGEFHVLVFGGSQGARAVNEIVKKAVLRDSAWRKDVRIVHQTGKHDIESVRKAYEGLEGVEALEYLHDMDQRYRWADVVICRSGASTVAELAAVRKPALLVPLPTAADDHQRKNAESLVSQGAGILLPQKSLTADQLIEELGRLKSDSQLRADMRERLGRFHKPRAAARIAELLMSGGDS